MNDFRVPEDANAKLLLHELTQYPLRHDGKGYRYGRVISGEELKTARELEQLGLVHIGFSFTKRSSTISIKEAGENLIGDYNPWA